MASYEATIHAQDATLGRVQHVLDGIRGASVAAGAYDAVEVAVAYASRTGVALLLRHLQQGPSWAKAQKRFLISLDFGITEPAALDLLMKQANLEVRVPNGQAVVASASLRPPHTFHAKGYLFRSNPWTAPSALIVGSANLSVSALATGSELMSRQIWHGTLSPTEKKHLRGAKAYLEWFEDAWAGADPVVPLMSQYKDRRRKLRVHGAAEEKTDAVKKYLADPGSCEVTGPLAVQLTAAQALWVKTETLYQNLPARNVGNQLDTPRGTRVFFGFPAAQVARNHVFGHVAIQVVGHASVARSVRFGNNMMDKVNLPVPGRNGPANYDHAVLIFDRAGTGQSALPLFRLSVTDDAGLGARKKAAANHIDLQMHGGREYGLIF